ncbi:MAG: YdcF family protein, partial [Oscillospiraceae bacterium]
ALGVFWKKFCALVKRLWKRIWGKIAVLLVGGISAFAAGICVFFSVNMILCTEKPLEKTEAVIILGCQVRGEEPSVMLKNRLDAALEVLRENPEAVCIASGGQGNGENISEAECMRRYLIANGIEDERIFIEDKSSSTEENLAFSREILENLGISDNIIIATSEFHQYRASIYAKKNGLQTGSHSAKTPVWNLLNYWVREWATLVMAYIK